MKTMNIKPELTAISTKHSKSAEMIANLMTDDSVILDYGCGTGRNMTYLLEQGACSLCGTDIPEQLKAQEAKHDALMEQGCLIMESFYYASNSFDLILCSHVLNVIESNSVKQNVVNDIANLLAEGGKAVIEVRTAHDVEAAKTKEAYKDGWLIKKGSAYTYQEALSNAKLEGLCINAGLKVVDHISNSSKHIIVVEK